jgi:hypothetical protein
MQAGENFYRNLETNRCREEDPQQPEIFINQRVVFFSGDYNHELEDNECISTHHSMI